MKLLLIGLVTIMTTTSAIACSCAMLTADKLLETSDTVFVGVPAGDSVLTGEVDSEWPTEMENKTPFYITKGYKNAKNNMTMDLFSTKGNGANCGINFQSDNGVYVVSAYKDPITGKLMTSSCNIAYLGSTYAIDLVKNLEELTNSN